MPHLLSSNIHDIHYLLKELCIDNTILTNFVIHGGAENGQFILAGNDDFLNVSPYKNHQNLLHNGDIIVAINQQNVCGYCQKDFNDLLKCLFSQNSKFFIKFIERASGFPAELSTFLNHRFEKGTTEHTLQLQIRENLYLRTVPCTTRPPRHGEQDGVDYNFLSFDQFTALQKTGQLIEFGIFEGNLYGTPRPIIPNDSKENSTNLSSNTSSSPKSPTSLYETSIKSCPINYPTTDQKTDNIAKTSEDNSSTTPESLCEKHSNLQKSLTCNIDIEYNSRNKNQSNKIPPYPLNGKDQTSIVSCETLNSLNSLSAHSIESIPSDPVGKSIDSFQSPLHVNNPEPITHDIRDQTFNTIQDFDTKKRNHISNKLNRTVSNESNYSANNKNETTPLKGNQLSCDHIKYSPMIIGHEPVSTLINNSKINIRENTNLQSSAKTVFSPTSSIISGTTDMLSTIQSSIYKSNYIHYNSNITNDQSKIKRWDATLNISPNDAFKQPQNTNNFVEKSSALQNGNKLDYIDYPISLIDRDKNYKNRSFTNLSKISNGCFSQSTKQLNHCGNNDVIIFTKDPLQLSEKYGGRLLGFHLAKSERGFGFTILGHGERDKEFLFVNKIVPDSPAFRDGNLLKGDILVYVNGVNVLGYSYSDILNLFNSIPVFNVIQIIICRGIVHAYPSEKAKPTNIFKHLNGHNNINNNNHNKTPKAVKHRNDGTLCTDYSNHTLPHKFKFLKDDVDHDMKMLAEFDKTKTLERQNNQPFNSKIQPRMGDSLDNLLRDSAFEQAQNKDNKYCSPYYFMANNANEVKITPPKISQSYHKNGFENSLNVHTPPPHQAEKMAANINNQQQPQQSRSESRYDHIKEKLNDCLTRYNGKTPPGFPYYGTINSPDAQTMINSPSPLSKNVNDGDRNNISILNSGLPNNNNNVKTCTLHRPNLNEGFGFIILSSMDGKSGSFINKILPNTPASRCPDLHRGQKIMAINGIDIQPRASTTIKQSEDTHHHGLDKTIVSESETSSHFTHQQIVELIKRSGLTLHLTLSTAGTSKYSLGNDQIGADLADSISDLSLLSRTSPPSINVNDYNKPNIIVNGNTNNGLTPFIPEYSYSSIEKYPPHTTSQQSMISYQEQMQQTNHYVSKVGLTTTLQQAISKENGPNNKHIFSVELFKGTRGFGFSIRGGKEFQNMPLYVYGIADSGPAHKDGRIQVGDQILEINGVKTDALTHAQALELIKSWEHTVRLVLLRSPTIQTCNSHLNGNVNANGFDATKNGIQYVSMINYSNKNNYLNNKVNDCGNLQTKAQSQMEKPLYQYTNFMNINNNKSYGDDNRQQLY